ncbi:MAG: serine acetyltransferase [Bacteroidales bacterium]|nr:serine acetyltransferase [Bacteroidales bacterium]
MDRMDILKLIKGSVESLNKEASVNFPYIQHYDKPLPSPIKIAEIIKLLRSIVFPGYFGDTHVRCDTLDYYTGVCLERLFDLLADEIHNGLCFDGHVDGCDMDKSLSNTLAAKFIEAIPEIKYLLSTDVKAIFDGDPAAKSYGEVIICYPSIRALLNHRIAHTLFKLGVPIIPRVISEMAHSETGIDIHPGARIGEYFAIDHGTGVVIGKTSIIGNHVKIYQGVTLGAKSFATDEEGALIDIPRHPILEDNVIIYSNTSVLGRITIGANSIIGGNVWLTQSVPPNSRILQQPSTQEKTICDRI